MLRVNAQFAYGVVATVYEGDIGDVVPWHNHPTPHGHFVVRGRTRVEIEGRTPFEMTPQDGNRELPPVLRHQVTAIEPGTVFIHMMAANGPVASPDMPDQPMDGGVMLFDGTVVHAAPPQ